MRLSRLLFLLVPSVFAAQPNPGCDLSQYKPSPGLSAAERAGSLEVVWTGERGEQMRAACSLRDGKPVVEELAARKAAGKWMVSGAELAPEYQVTTGRRRLSEQQMEPLRELESR